MQIVERELQWPLPSFEYGGAGDIDEDWPHRPVGLRVGPSGDLFVTSDRSGVVIRIRYVETAQ